MFDSIKRSTNLDSTNKQPDLNQILWPFVFKKKKENKKKNKDKRKKTHKHMTIKIPNQNSWVSQNSVQLLELNIDTNNSTDFYILLPGVKTCHNIKFCGKDKFEFLIIKLIQSSYVTQSWEETKTGGERKW